MRFLLVPFSAHFQDSNMLRGLSKALRKLGQEVILLNQPLMGYEVETYCRDLAIDVLFQVNQPRPYDLPRPVRHITWFQDPVIPADLIERIQPSDIVYQISGNGNHTPAVGGRCHTGYLFLGVDETMLDAFVPPQQKTVDFSFCGNLPSKLTARRRSSYEEMLWRWRNRIEMLPVVGGAAPVRVLLNGLMRGRLPLFGIPIDKVMALMAVLEAYYVPLQGQIDVAALKAKVRELVEPQLGPLSPQMKKAWEALLENTVFPGARSIDRATAVENVLRVTNSVELWGAGWNSYEKFALYHRGVLTGPQAILSLYARSRLSGTNTLGGFGMHSRNLECMAVGGFLFTHSSPGDAETGGLKTSFEPGVHYGEYMADTIEEEAMRWIRDDGRRDEAGRRAAAIVRERHLWRHRAIQVLDDLKA
jgi:hypothetical protein